MRRILFALAFTCFVFPASAADFSFWMVNPNFVLLGDPIDYYIVITVGSTPAPSTSIVDPLPPGLEFVSGSLVCYMPSGSGDCSYDAPTRTVSWTGSLGAYAAVDILFSVTTTGLAGPGYVTNTATASATGYTTEEEAHTTVAYVKNEWLILDDFMMLGATDPDSQMHYATGVSWNSISETFLAAWNRVDQNTTQEYVLVRSVDPTGLLGEIHQVNEVPVWGEMPYSAKVACSSTTENCLVAWQETEPVNWFTGIRARLVDGDGVPVGSEFIIAEDSNVTRMNVDVVYNSVLDEYLVAYQNYWSGGGVDVAATRVRASDGLLLGSAIVATGADGDRGMIRAAHLAGRDQYLLVYNFEDLLENEQARAKFAHGDLSGVAAAPELVLSTGPGEGSVPVVGAQGDEYLVAWRYTDDAWPPTTTEVRTRRFAGDGTPLGPPGGFLIDEFEGTATIQVRQVRFAGEQGFLVGWYYSDSRCATGVDQHGRFVEFGADQAAYLEFPAVATTDHDGPGYFACSEAGQCMILTEYSDGVKARFVTAWRAHTDGFEDGGFGGWTSVTGASP